MNGGRYDPSKGYSSWPIRMYYDDIDHTGRVHHAYFLRFFEHAREHILGEDCLVDLYENEHTMFVATKTEQTHKHMDVGFGDVLDIRTKIRLDGKFRVRFEHEAFLGEIVVCQGYVEMVCLDSVTGKIVPIPARLEPISTPLENKVPRKIGKPAAANGGAQVTKQQTLCEYQATVGNYDTDFTKVVYQAKYLQFYEASMKQLFRQLNVLSLLHKHDVTYLVYRAIVEFKEAVQPDDEIRVITTAKCDGTHKIVLDHQLYRSGAAKPANIAKVELICVQNGKVVEFPLEIRGLF